MITARVYACRFFALRACLCASLKGIYSCNINILKYSCKTELMINFMSNILVPLHLTVYVCIYLLHALLISVQPNEIAVLVLLLAFRKNTAFGVEH